jgi:hypothetical protein
LWTSREQLPTQTVAGRLALEVELLRERLQRQTDTALRAESALTQLAMGQQVSHLSSAMVTLKGLILVYVLYKALLILVYVLYKAQQVSE